MLRADDDLSGLGNEGREYDGHLDDVGAMQVEGLTRDAVETVNLEAGFLTNLANRRALRAFVRLDTAVYRLPRSRTPRARRAAKQQHQPLVAIRPNDVHIDDADTEIGHARVRAYALSLRSARSRALNARGRNGFVRKSFAPLSNTRTSFSSSPFAVSKIGRAHV